LLGDTQVDPRFDLSAISAQPACLEFREFVANSAHLFVGSIAQEAQTYRGHYVLL